MTQQVVIRILRVKIFCSLVRKVSKTLVVVKLFAHFFALDTTLLYLKMLLLWHKSESRWIICLSPL